MRYCNTFCIVCGNKIRLSDAAMDTRHPEFFTCANDECVSNVDNILQMILTEEVSKKIYGNGEHFSSFDYEAQALSSLTAACKETTDLICRTFARLDEFERETYLKNIADYIKPVEENLEVNT